MTIQEAIAEAKKNFEWSIVQYEPTTVRIGFLSKWYETDDNYHHDETEFDLYDEDKETELAELWESQCEELGSALDKVEYVEAYGYIAE